MNSSKSALFSAIIGAALLLVALGLILAFLPNKKNAVKAQGKLPVVADTTSNGAGGENRGRTAAYRLIGAAFLLLTALSLSSCADAPPWLGGLPADAPPRPGTPQYEAWMAQRAQEAARPKQGQEQPK